MKKLGNSTLWIISSQKRFRAFRPRENIALHQQIHNAPQQEQEFHPDKMAVAWEKIGNLKKSWEWSPMSENSVFKFLTKYSSEDLKNMTDEQVHELVHGNDIYQFCQALTPEQTMDTWNRFVKDAGPLVENIEPEDIDFDTETVRNHMKNMPKNLQKELEIEQDEMEFMEKHFDKEEGGAARWEEEIRAREFREYTEDERKAVLEIESAIREDEKKRVFEMYDKYDAFGLQGGSLKGETEEGMAQDFEQRGKKLDDVLDKMEEWEADELTETLTDKHDNSILKPEHAIAYLKERGGVTLTPEEEKNMLETFYKQFAFADHHFNEAVVRIKEVADEEKHRDEPKMEIEDVSVSSDMGDKMWQLHKQDPRLWNGERLGGLFGISRERAWGEICVRECWEAQESGKPFNYDKLEYLFQRGKVNVLTPKPHYFKFKTKYLTEEDAYKDFLKASENPAIESGDDLLPDWVALPFQPYRTLEKEPETKTLEQPERMLDFGNDRIKTRLLFGDFSKEYDNDPNKYKVRELDGSLRTATWTEQKHFTSSGREVQKLKVGKMYLKKRKVQMRKRKF